MTTMNTKTTAMPTGMTELSNSALAGTEEAMAETKMQAEPAVVTQIAPAGSISPAASAQQTQRALAEGRSKLDGKTGRRFWKNLDELAETESFQQLMAEEFPRQAGSSSEWVDAVSRRGFLKVRGAW